MLSSSLITKNILNDQLKFFFLLEMASRITKFLKLFLQNNHEYIFFYKVLFSKFKLNVSRTNNYMCMYVYTFEYVLITLL